MDLIKEVAKEKLVIMVTHDVELAENMPLELLDYMTVKSNLTLIHTILLKKPMFLKT